MPSAKVLEGKKAHVSKITELLKGAQTGVIVDYRGFTVEEDTKLRSKLRENGCKYIVIKNTLLKLATKEAGLEALDDCLHGPTALAVCDSDPVAPAKILAEFAKGNDNLEIKSGFMDGNVLSLDEIKQLAATPGMDTLIAKIMGSMNAPISNLVRLMQTIVDDGVEIPDLIAKKNGADVPAAAPAEETKEEAEEEAKPETEAAPAAEAEEAKPEENAAE